DGDAPGFQTGADSRPPAVTRGGPPACEATRGAARAAVRGRRRAPALHRSRRRGARAPGTARWTALAARPVRPGRGGRSDSGRLAARRRGAAVRSVPADRAPAAAPAPSRLAARSSASPAHRGGEGDCCEDAPPCEVEEGGLRRDRLPQQAGDGARREVREGLNRGDETERRTPDLERRERRDGSALGRLPRPAPP